MAVDYVDGRQVNQAVMGIGGSSNKSERMKLIFGRKSQLEYC